MTGAHGSPPLGSAARDATASPWHGKHRAERTPAAEFVDDATLSQMPPTCRCSRVRNLNTGLYRLFRTNGCPDHDPPDGDDAPYFPGGMSHRENRVRDQNGDHQ